MLTASGSASKRPSAPEGQKPAVGRAAAAPITEVDYTDIPNTQIRRVKSLILSNCENSNLKEHWWIQLLVSRLCVVPKHPDGVQLLNLNFGLCFAMQVTAKRLLLSKQTIPHYYLSIDTHVDKLLKYVLSLNKGFQGVLTFNVTFQTHKHLCICYSY